MLNTNRIRALFAALTVVAAVTLAQAAPAPSEPQPQPAKCARCQGPIVERLKVVVTDFATRQDSVYCNLACALPEMEKLPTSRAVVHDPFAGKEVRVIRTGVRWVAWSKQAVFLYLPEAQDLEFSSRCLAFPSQVQYIQYLATHPAVSEHKPKPLRLPALLDAVRKQKPN